MAAGARHASEVLGREVFLWEIQRILDGVKRIPGLEVIRADMPIPRRKPKKRQSDLAMFTLRQAKTCMTHARLSGAGYRVTVAPEALESISGLSAT